MRPALCAIAIAIAPALAAGQTTPTGAPLAQRTVVVLPFRGRATQDRIDDVERTVRAVLASQGARVPDVVAVRMSLGVDAPRDAASAAGFGRVMSGTHVVAGEVQPLSGQYNLTLTLTEVATARVATQQVNVGDDDAGSVLARAITALFDPSALGPAPVDPEEERRRREEEARRQAEERQRAESRRREEEARRRAAEAERQRRYELENPERRFDQGGPVGVGAGLHAGGHFSGRPGASPLAFLLRLEGSYAIAAVPGLEVLGAVMLMTAPSTALGLGGGAQFTWPARGRGRFRGTGGVVLGLFQGLSGAQLTSVWVEPFARAELHASSTVAIFAGLSLDATPGDNGGITALTAAAGVRLRVGSPPTPNGARDEGLAPSPRR